MPFVLGVITALVLGWGVFPQVLFSKHQQPFAFSHKAHLNQGLDCTNCHQYREDGSYAGIPSLETCSQCHFDVITKAPEEKIFVNNYVKKGLEVPWRVYQKQPDNVYFSHQAHQYFECTTCHPDVGHSENLPPYFENKLTGYSKQTMKMYQCERCHAESGVSNACYVCHK